jgi:predicted nucleotidyltransferase
MKLTETLNVLKEELLKPSLTKHCFNISTYGSAAREKDFDEDWSDVDVLIIPNYDFKCPVEFYHELGSSYTRIRERIEEKVVEWGIEDEIGFSVYDKGSIESGRYAWMLESFKEHLRKSAKTFWGKDIKTILSKEQPRANEESGIAYGLWRTRVTASELDYNRKHDERNFVYNFKRSTKALGSFFRNAIILKNEKPKFDDKHRIAEQFIDLFPEVDHEAVLEVLGVPLLWPDKLDKKDMEELFYKGLRIREETVKSLSKNP